MTPGRQTIISPTFPFVAGNITQTKYGFDPQNTLRKFGLSDNSMEGCNRRCTVSTHVDLAQEPFNLKHEMCNSENNAHWVRLLPACLKIFHMWL